MDLVTHARPHRARGFLASPAPLCKLDLCGASRFQPYLPLRSSGAVFTTACRLRAKATALPMSMAFAPWA